MATIMSNVDPFGTLLEIEQACKKNALPLPRQKKLGETWAGIGFIIDNLQFVAPLSDVSEVLTFPIVTPIPSSATWFKGIANFRGHPLPITDLQHFIRGTSSLISPLSRVLVVNFQKFNVGFLVNQVLGIQHFLEKNRLQVDTKTIDEQFLPFLQGEFSEENKNWKILSFKALSETTKFYHVIQASQEYQ